MSQLTTLTNLRQWLAISSNSTTDDALLTRLITATSGVIESYLSRTIASAAYTDVIDGQNTLSVLFRNYPVTAVSAVSVDGVVIPANVTQPATYGYVFSETKLSLIDYVFTRGFQNVSISYTAGYASTPFEIEQACIELCSLRYRERDRIGQKSKSVGGEVLGYVTADMPDSVKTLLAQYKRVTYQ